MSEEDSYINLEKCDRISLLKLSNGTYLQDIGKINFTSVKWSGNEDDISASDTFEGMIDWGIDSNYNGNYQKDIRYWKIKLNFRKDYGFVESGYLKSII